MFAPDLIAVLDVDPHDRDHWVVAHEGRGLDFALEILLRRDRRKDLQRNVERYAGLGIREYFIFDRKRVRLSGHRLIGGVGSYQPIIPQHGRWRSETLGLELGIEGERLRLFAGTAPIPELQELAERGEALLENAQRLIEAAEQRAEEEAQRAEQEAQRAEQEAQRAARAEAEVRRLREMLAALERER